MKSGITKEGIYIELDVLLDTRIATVARICEDSAVRVLKSGYHTRESDNFPEVDMTVYRDLYAKRDVETLAKSHPTQGMALLGDLVDKLLEQAACRPYHSGAMIYVNAYPYKLSKLEIAHVGLSIMDSIKNKAPVEIVYIEPKDLTPSHCKASYALMVAYEYEDWLEMHAPAFRTTQLAEISLLAPAIYFKQVPSPEQVAEEKRESAHPMSAIEMLVAPIIGLQLIDIKYFSIISG